MLDKFLMVKDNMFVFTGYELDLYIPQSYFDTKMASYHGNVVNSFGVLHYKVRDKTGKILEKGFTNMPVPIAFQLSDIDTVDENILGTTDGEITRYNVIKYLNGQSICPNIISESSKHVEAFVKLILNGKLDPNIPYDKVIYIWLKNMEYGGKDLKVPLVILELIISKVYRYKKNPDKTFAKVIGKDPKTSPTAYTCFNARTIAAHNSTFSAMTFEDMDSMITTSLNSNNYNKTEEESPIEKIIKM